MKNKDHSDAAGRSVISKVAAILRALGARGSLTVTEIAQATGLPVSTAHRLVGELTAWRLLHRGSDGRYEVTGGPMTRCAGVWNPPGIWASAPVVEDLSAVTQSDVRLGLLTLTGARVTYMEKVSGLRPLADATSTAPLPAHATAMGRVLLAFSGSDVVRRVLAQRLHRYTPSTLTTAAAIANSLRAIRLDGIAVVSGELSPDYSGVAAPVFYPDGRIAAALEVRLRGESTEWAAIVPALTIAARGISRDLARIRLSDTGAGTEVVSPLPLHSDRPIAGGSA